MKNIFYYETLKTHSENILEGSDLDITSKQKYMLKVCQKYTST